MVRPIKKRTVEEIMSRMVRPVIKYNIEDIMLKFVRPTNKFKVIIHHYGILQFIPGGSPRVSYVGGFINEMKCDPSLMSMFDIEFCIEQDLGYEKYACYYRVPNTKDLEHGLRILKNVSDMRDMLEVVRGYECIHIYVTLDFTNDDGRNANMVEDDIDTEQDAINLEED